MNYHEFAKKLMYDEQIVHVHFDNEDGIWWVKTIYNTYCWIVDNEDSIWGD